jgi:hypothetical protein
VTNVAEATAPVQSGPLRGLRVIELSNFVASPSGKMTLAQLGADVIRVDPIGGGPDTDRWPLAPTERVCIGRGSTRANVGELVEASGEQGGIVPTNARGLGFPRLAELRRRGIMGSYLRNDKTDCNMNSPDDDERAIVATVRDFVDRDVRPVAQELEHSNTYPEKLIDQMN